IQLLLQDRLDELNSDQSDLSSLPDNLSTLSIDAAANGTAAVTPAPQQATPEVEATLPIHPASTEVAATLPSSRSAQEVEDALPVTPVRSPEAEATLPATPIRRHQRHEGVLASHRSQPTPLVFTPEVTFQPSSSLSDPSTIHQSFTEASFTWGPVNKDEPVESDSDSESGPDTTAFLSPHPPSDREDSPLPPLRERGWNPSPTPDDDEITFALRPGDPQQLLLQPPSFPAPQQTPDVSIPRPSTSPELTPTPDHIREPVSPDRGSDTRIHLSLNEISTPRRIFTPTTLGLSPALQHFSSTIRSSQPHTHKMAPEQELTPNMIALFEKFLMQKGMDAVTSAANTDKDADKDKSKSMDYVTKEALKPEVLGVFDPAYRADPKDMWLYKGPPVVSDAITWDSRLDRLYDLSPDAATAGALQETYNRGAAMDWWLYQVSEPDK
ncbi:hypothetical protein BJ508DRAFT_337079, partial [Ascobolus immersus RN42]